MLRYHVFLLDQGETTACVKMWDLREGRMSGVYGAWSKVRQMGASDDCDSGEPINITSAYPTYRKWWWLPLTGILQIGTDFPRASHKEGEDRVQDALITLRGVRRHDNGMFFASGSGWMAYTAPPLSAGPLDWTVQAYHGLPIANTTIAEPAWGYD